MVCIHSFYIDLYQHIYTVYDIPIPILAGGGIGNGSTKFFWSPLDPDRNVTQANSILWLLAIISLSSVAAYDNNSANATRQDKALSIFNVVSRWWSWWTGWWSWWWGCWWPHSWQTGQDQPHNYIFNKLQSLISSNRWSSPTVFALLPVATMAHATGLIPIKQLKTYPPLPPPASSSWSSPRPPSSSECESAGGTGSGTCASSFGVCCVFRSSSSSSSSQSSSVSSSSSPPSWWSYSLSFTQHCLWSYDEPEQLLCHHQQLLHQVFGSTFHFLPFTISSIYNI